MRLDIHGLVGFEWDEANREKSERRHGIAASEAEEALLNDPLCQLDRRYSEDEQRFVALGLTNDGRRLFLSFTIRRNRARIISARPMSRKERVSYEEAKANEGR